MRSNADRMAIELALLCDAEKLAAAQKYHTIVAQALLGKKCKPLPGMIEDDIVSASLLCASATSHASCTVHTP
jgi:hypothetical protein